MEDKKIDNTIYIFEEVFEKYKEDEELKESYEQLKKLKEKRKKKNQTI